MPVVPIEENKVGIASLTDAKLRPADLSGSGLDAIGSGLRAVGKAGFDLGKAVGGKATAPGPGAGTDETANKPASRPAAAKDPAKTGAPARKMSEAQSEAPIKAAPPHAVLKPDATPPISLTPIQAGNDAAVKGGYCDYAEAARQVLDPDNRAPSDQQGTDPVASARGRSDQLNKIYEGVAAHLSPEQQQALHAVMLLRLAQDHKLIRTQEASAALVTQRQQSQRVVDTSASDAADHFGTPTFAQSMATGLRQFDEQAALGNLTPEAKRAAETSFISRVHRKIAESYATGDVILGAEHLRLFGDHMTAEDRAPSWDALHGPLVQIQAVADADTPWLANATTAPLTPPGDAAMLVRRMLAITPATHAGGDGSGAGADDRTDLPALVEHYGGDAAKAWTASAIGTDALDALVAKHGVTWFGALPRDTRYLIAANMAMLGAATSPRRAPTPAERADLAGDIEDQPWSDERKQNAYTELNTRIGLEAQRVKKTQDDAWETGLATADQLGARFISVNQLPPAVRTNLSPDALTALTLRADRNVHPATVAAHGDVAMALNRMAATDPEGFAKEDLRLHRDEVTPAEYDALDRVQTAWSGYPPGAHGVNQQRIGEKIVRSGLPMILPAVVTNVLRGGDGFSDTATGSSANSNATAGTAAGGAMLQPAVYLNGVGGRVNENNGTVPATDPPTPSLTRQKPAATAKAPIDLSLPIGTIDNHPHGKYRDPTHKNRSMAGNQIVRSPAQIAENIAEMDDYLKDPLARAIFDTIASTEGTAVNGYYNGFDKAKLSDLSEFPYKTNHAAGRYQLLGDTFDEIGKARLGLTDFSPLSQDRTAAWLLKSHGIMDALRRGDIPAAIEGASEQWASIPISAKHNHSAFYYKRNGKYVIDPKTGEKKVQPSVDYNEVVKRFRTFLIRYDPSSPLLAKQDAASPKR